MEDVNLLSHACPPENRQPNLFHVLDDAARARFHAVCNPVMFKPGQSLFVQGNVHDRSFIIEQGLVRIYYVAPSGREITLGYWSSGDVVGGPSILGGGVHVWSGVAVGEARVLSITGKALRDFALSDPEVSRWIIDVLSFKLRWMSILFQTHGTECAEDRLARLLLLLADNYGEPSEAGLVINCKISQGDLGTLIGVSRQWTNKILNEFKKRGYLFSDRRRIVLRDLSALRCLTQPAVI